MDLSRGPKLHHSKCGPGRGGEDSVEGPPTSVARARCIADVAQLVEQLFRKQ
jgi:hypothetical protein